MNSLFSVAFGNSSFVAVGEIGTALTSTNGVVWLTHDTGATDDLNRIGFGNGTFVAVGDNGTRKRICRTTFTGWSNASLRAPITSGPFGPDSRLGGKLRATEWSRIASPEPYGIVSQGAFAYPNVRYYRFRTPN